MLAERPRRGCEAAAGERRSEGGSERPGRGGAEGGEAVGASAGLQALSGSQRTRVSGARA